MPTPVPTTEMPPELQAVTLDPELKQAMARWFLAAQARQRRESLPPPSAVSSDEPFPNPPPPTKVIQLDFWDDDRRGAPNAVFRAALFPVLDTKKKRQFLKEEKVFAVKGLAVYFTGEQFSQSDLDVYLEILHLARPLPLGTPIKFTAYAMLKALGRSTGSHDHQWLHSVLIRLRSGTVDITDHQVRYAGGLIDGIFRNELSKEYEVTINPKFAVLFGYGLWSSVDIAQRQDLGRDETAKALHGYYSGHSAPDFHHYDTLSGIIGLQDKEAKRRKAKLIKAHQKLAAIGFLSGYHAAETSIKADIIPTPAQVRYAIEAASNKRSQRLKSRSS